MTTTWVDNSTIPRANPRWAKEAVDLALKACTMSWAQLVRLSDDRRAFKGLCSHAVGIWYGWDASGGNANVLWPKFAKQWRHTSGFRTAPAGALLWYDIGTYDHVMLSVGGGYAVSNDIRRSGYVDRVPISEIHNKWGARELFWTPAYFAYAGGPVGPLRKEPAPNAPVVLPKISASKVQSAARIDPVKPQGYATYKPGVLLVERALANMGHLDRDWVDGSYGTKTIVAMGSFQKAIGSTVTGRPTVSDLTRLGARSKTFTVTA